MKIKLMLTSLAFVIASQAVSAYPEKCPSLEAVKSFATSSKWTMHYEVVRRAYSWSATLDNEFFDTKDAWTFSVDSLGYQSEAEARAMLVLKMQDLGEMQGPFYDSPNKGETECTYLGSRWLGSTAVHHD